MIFAWDPKLAVGVGLIDEQHQELFRRVNDLLEALHAARGNEESGRLLVFLGKYVIEHFRAEERLMASNAYPQAADHKQQHVDFVRTFSDLKSEFDKDGPSLTLAIKLNHAVCGWLRQHIGSTDMALGQFLKARGEAAAA